MKRIILLLNLLWVLLPAHAQDLFLAPVKQHDRWGYIDMEGKYLISPKYESANDFAENLAAVRINGKWGYIDGTGNVIIAAKFQDAHSFMGGMARVRFENMWGYINNLGEMVIPPQFDVANDFMEGLALVRNYGKYGFINKNGKFVIEPIFDDAYNFSEGCALVMQYGKWGFVGKEPGIRELPLSAEASPFFSEGLAAIQLRGKYGFVDQQGNIKIEPQYDYAKDFSETLAAVSFNGQYGYMAYSGKFVVLPAFEQAEHFSEGLAAVKSNGRYGYINTKGSIVIPALYDEAQPFKNGLAKVKQNNRYGIIDNGGNWAVAPQYDWIFDFSEGLAVVESSQRYGYVTPKDQLQIMPIYESAGSFQRVTTTANSMPHIIVQAPAESPLQSQQPYYDLKATIKSASPILDKSVLVNNELYDLNDLAQKGTRIVQMNQNDLTISIRIKLKEGKNKITLKAVNRQGSATSEPREIIYQPEIMVEKPNLYILTIGISEFEQKEYNIKYADDDANDIAAIFDAQNKLPNTEKLYGRVTVQKLTNEQATANNIRKAILDMKRAANEKDLFVLHISSHGEVDSRNNYYIRTYETDAGIEYLSATALENRWLADQIRDFKCTTIQLIDACHSGAGSDIALRGAAGMDIAISELKQALSAKALYFFASASSQEMAQERGEWSNGAFTEAILACFNQQKYYNSSNGQPITADSNNDGFINTDELNAYIAQVVKVLTNGEQTPRTTIEQGTPINLFVLPK